MNQPFRTAFWAMCLGLTLPMLLFIGAELVSGNQHAPLLSQGNRHPNAGKAAIQSDNRSDRAHDPNFQRVRAKESSSSPSIAAASRAARQPSAARTPLPGNAGETPEPATSVASRMPAQLEAIEPELADLSLPPWSSRPDSAAPGSSPVVPGGVQLGPQLEQDTGIQGINVGLETRKPDRNLPGRLPQSPVESGAAREPSSAQIETRLARIQQHLDQLTHTLLMQTQQKQQEQLQQSSQLMQQIQQAGRLQELERQLSRLQETADALHESTQASGRRESPFGRSAKPAAQRTLHGPTTKVYYPRQISADELLSQIAPLLTHGTGRANSAGVPLSPAEIARSGQNAAINPPRVVVTDDPAVHVEIERLMREVDLPPTDIMLDARVYALTLAPDTRRGFDFAQMNRNDQPWVVTSSEQQGAGLNFGILNGRHDEFVRDLEQLTVLRTVATPRASVPERRPADLIIGRPVRANDVAAADQNPQTSPGATRLRIRPFRAAGGIRLEISQFPAGAQEPQESTPALQSTTPVGRIFVPHGQTAIITGMIEPPAPVAEGEGTNDATPADRVDRWEYFVLLTPMPAASPKQ